MESLAAAIVAEASLARDVPATYKYAFGSLGVFALLEICVNSLLRLRFPKLTHRSLVIIRGCLVSCAHDLWAIVAVILLARYTTQPAASPPAAGPLGLALLAHVPFAVMDKIGGILLGYLLWDLQHYVAHSTTYSRTLVEQVVHHACFMLMIWLNWDTLWFNYAFAPMYIGELSTLFLNVRMVHREFDRTESWASAAFAVTFIATRVVIFGALVGHLLLNQRAARQLLSPPLQLSYLVLVPAMWALNLFWSTKVIAAVRKRTARPRGTANSKCLNGKGQ